jgi:cysteine-S-conjugate beta-lyase
MNPAMHYREPARRDTFLARTGRDPEAFGGLVNTPVCRGSTIVASTLEEWESRKEPGNAMASYGRFGTATTRAFESAMAQLEGGDHAIVFPSGLAACTHAILAIVRPGDHVLITDSVYGPTRQFAARVLVRLGVDVEFFDPAMAADACSRLRPGTRMVYLESPGSLTFEMQDVPAIAQAARRRGAFVVMDNTWATPLFFKPFEHGVDVSIQAATKYIVGHSDALLGIACANARAWDLLRQGAHDFGQTAGPDDIYLALRGLRSLSVRLRRHHHNGIALAQALQAHPAVRQVLHPGMPGDAGHALWQRDCHGASGLFGIVLRPMAREQLSRFFASLQLFSIGLSWGGYESLVLPVDTPQRSVRPFRCEGQLVRVHAGLEDVDDLIRDFSAALEHAARA